MIAFERLAALALGELSGDEQDGVELHVLSCGACAATLEQLLQLGELTRRLVLSGSVRTFVLPPLAARMTELGLISRHYRLAQGEVVPCSVGADDLYALTELSADLKQVQQVDLLVASPELGERRVRDVPFDPNAGTVAFVERSDALRLLPTTRLTLRLLAVEGERERELGRYVLEHSAGP